MANIAIVFPAYAGGGAENVAITVGDMLMSRYGHKIHIWASRMAPGFEDSLSAKGYQVENFARSFKARIHEPRTSRHIADLVHSHDIDVLIISVNAVGCAHELRRSISPRCKIVFHLHGTPMWELQDALTKRTVAAGKPLKKLAANFKYASATIRENLLHSYSKRFERRYRDMFDISDSYWLLCRGYADRLAGLLGEERDNPKIKVMPNPVDTGRFMPLANCEKKKEVLFVGRLTYADKRVDRLLRIWAEVSKHNPDWSLHIVGDGKDRPNLEKLAGELALKNITFHGYRDPAPHYESASVLCMTSTFEGWPQVLVEAMSSGVVPIAFGCTDGVREILGDGRGVLVEGFDEKAYAAELHRLLQDRQGLEQRRALYPAYAAQFDCGTIAELWHESISLLMGPHSARNDC